MNTQSHSRRHGVQELVEQFGRVRQEFRSGSDYCFKLFPKTVSYDIGFSINGGAWFTTPGGPPPAAKNTGKAENP